jgi:predicted RNA-binding Zn-ribbon protein involved in translation (DUF1610 family)
LELLNRKGNLAFFDLQLGGRKANNAQKEKRRLARKRSRASKREREREAAKAAKLPTHERQCVSCGRKFNSRKTAKKHKCPNSKVVRMPREAASGQASQATPVARLDMPTAPPTSHAPTDPPHNSAIPVVTGDSQEPSESFRMTEVATGRRITAPDRATYWRFIATPLWREGW